MAAWGPTGMGIRALVTTGALAVIIPVADLPAGCSEGGSFGWGAKAGCDRLSVPKGLLTAWSAVLLPV